MTNHAKQRQRLPVHATAYMLACMFVFAGCVNDIYFTATTPSSKSSSSRSRSCTSTSSSSCSIFFERRLTIGKKDEDGQHGQAHFLLDLFLLLLFFTLLVLLLFLLRMMMMIKAAKQAKEHRRGGSDKQVSIKIVRKLHC